MLTLPKIVECLERHYISIAATIPMNEIGNTAEKLYKKLDLWLFEYNNGKTGIPFIKYNTIDMARLLKMEFGYIVENEVIGSDDIITGKLPAGRYAIITNIGPYDELLDVNAVLIGWAKQRGIIWDSKQTSEGESFSCRIEIYRSDEIRQPDPIMWQTDVLIKLSDTYKDNLLPSR